MRVGVSMTKVIVLDLDNTLLRNDKNISGYTIGVLEKCQAVGIKIAFATARSTQSSSRILAQFRPDIFVGYGGAVVLESDQVIHQFDISAEVASQVIKECLATPEIVSILAINESIALTNNLEKLAEKDSSHYRYADFLDDNKHSYLKITLVAHEPDAVEKIVASYPMLKMMRYTGEDLYTLASGDALKWNALKAVAKHYGIDTDAFLAFGDDVNDLEMVANCGIGIAVANAIDGVKAVADYVCDTNDNDGVAKWIDEYVLKAQCNSS